MLAQTFERVAATGDPEVCGMQRPRRGDMKGLVDSMRALILPAGVELQET